MVRSDASRGHPDDEAHRAEIRILIRDIWRASGIRGRSWNPDGATDLRRDWKASSVQRWADRGHLITRFDLIGLDVPEPFREAPEGETMEQARVRARDAVRATRQAMGVPMLEMDRRMEQRPCCYHRWECDRYTDFRLAPMQRAVRALGGVFRVEFEHRHNPALLERIRSRQK